MFEFLQSWFQSTEEVENPEVEKSLEETDTKEKRRIRNRPNELEKIKRVKKSVRFTANLKTKTKKRGRQI
jgi:hypothetical protein